MKIFSSLSLTTLVACLSPSTVVADELVLGNFIDRFHDVTGELVALSDRVLEIRGFTYDGTAPDAFFWADSSAVPSRSGYILADGAPSSNCGEDKLGAADGTETYRVEFPDGTSLRDIAGGSISVWCRAFAANFGEVVIPENLEGLKDASDGPALECSESAPGDAVTPGDTTAYDDISQTPEGYNCEPLHEDFQVRWKVDGDEVAIELVGLIEQEHYLGFGISGSDQRTEMIGADVIIGDLFQGEFRANDYYMSARAQCSIGAGVCPDATTYNNGATEVSGARDDAAGLTVIRYRRPLLATDAAALVSGVAVDRDISVVPGESTYIAWAIGPVSADTGFPNFHSVAYPREDVTLEFGRAVVDNCEPLIQVEDGMDDVEAFERPVLRGETELRATIGLSGGDRGYQAISGGRVGWGIAWYINDYLLPVIEMERGTTYTFYVNGGDVPTDSANYHPMYLTTSISGGYAQLTQEERMAESIFGGLTVLSNGTYEATAAGPICKFEATDLTPQTLINGTYEEFFNSMNTSCLDDEAITDNAAVLQFTPDENTPDLLYYQCVTHRNLGWEIRVVDPGMTFNQTDSLSIQKNVEADEEEKPASNPSMRGAATSDAAYVSHCFGALFGLVGFLMI